MSAHFAILCTTCEQDSAPCGNHQTLFPLWLITAAAEIGTLAAAGIEFSIPIPGNNWAWDDNQFLVDHKGHLLTVCGSYDMGRNYRPEYAVVVTENTAVIDEWYRWRSQAGTNVLGPFDAAGAIQAAISTELPWTVETDKND